MNTEKTVKALLIVSLTLGIINGAINLIQNSKMAKKKKCSCTNCPKNGKST